MISAAPQEIIQSALEGIVPADHIFGTRFRYNEATGEVSRSVRASAGWGKITVLEELRAQPRDQPRPDYLHGRRQFGFAGDDARESVRRADDCGVGGELYYADRAKRTVLSDNAMSVLVPVLEEVLRWDSARIRRFFASHGLMLREWDKMRTDMLTIQESGIALVSTQPQ